MVPLLSVPAVLNNCERLSKDSFIVSIFEEEVSLIVDREAEAQIVARLPWASAGSKGLSVAINFVSLRFTLVWIRLLNVT